MQIDSVLVVQNPVEMDWSTGYVFPILLLSRQSAYQGSVEYAIDRGSPLLYYGLHVAWDFLNLNQCLNQVWDGNTFMVQTYASIYWAQFLGYNM